MDDSQAVVESDSSESQGNIDEKEADENFTHDTKRNVSQRDDITKQAKPARPKEAASRVLSKEDQGNSKSQGALDIVLVSTGTLKFAVLLLQLQSIACVCSDSCSPRTSGKCYAACMQVHAWELIQSCLIPQPYIVKVKLTHSINN